MRQTKGYMNKTLLERAVEILELQMDECEDFGVDIDDNGGPDIVMRSVQSMERVKELIRLHQKRSEAA